jgi:arginyl-tRNA synthetase
MENVSEKIYSILQHLASDLGIKDLDFSVEKPKDQSHGDLASNIALVLAQKLHKKPIDIANQIAEKIILEKDLVSDVKIAPPGFINFYFSKEYLASQLQEIIEQGEGYGSSNLGKGKKASVEFVSANPTGPLHIGNARGGPLGDTIANVLSKAGYQVKREYLHNDVGGQVDRLGESIYFTLNPGQKPENYEIQYQGGYIKELSEDIKEALAQDDGFSQEEFIEKAGKIAVEIMLEEILKDCQDMGIKFDKIRKESDLRREVSKSLDRIKKSLKENEGALWFAPNDEFLKDRETVVKKSDGQYTYFASDIAYHNEKMSQNDIVIDILGANHSGHVPRLKAVVKALGFDPDNLRVVLYQWIRLKRGEEIVKMSKRAGSFVTAKEVLDEVGEDAFRFFLLMPRSQTHMDFDLDLAKKKASDNPVFYVQYAYTRICSIFKKAGSVSFETANLNLLNTPEEINLTRFLIKFPYLVEEVAKNLEVNGLTTYALELANLLHKFYEKEQVISKDEKLTKARLALLKATQITLKNNLDLLGVRAPEQM